MIRSLGISRRTARRGTEYTLENLNKDEVQSVQSNGGQIIFAPRIYDVSTTKILEKLK